MTADEHRFDDDSNGLWAEDDQTLIYPIGCPIQTGIVCCDCSLVHLVHFEVVGQELHVRFAKNVALTEKAREHVKGYLTGSVFRHALEWENGEHWK